MAAAGSSSRAARSLKIVLAGLAVAPPLRQASLHLSTSAAACSTCSNSPACCGVHISVWCSGLCSFTQAQAPKICKGSCCETWSQQQQHSTLCFAGGNTQVRGGGRGRGRNEEIGNGKGPGILQSFAQLQPCQPKLKRLYDHQKLGESRHVMPVHAPS